MCVRAGNVILSPEVWSLVENRCEGELLEGGFVRLSHIVGHVSAPLPPQDSYEIKRVPKAVHILKRYGTDISECYSCMTKITMLTSAMTELN